MIDFKNIVKENSKNFGLTNIQISEIITKIGEDLSEVISFDENLFKEINLIERLDAPINNNVYHYNYFFFDQKNSTVNAKIVITLDKEINISKLINHPNYVKHYLEDVDWSWDEELQDEIAYQNHYVVFETNCSLIELEKNNTQKSLLQKKNLFIEALEKVSQNSFSPSLIIEFVNSESFRDKVYTIRELEKAIFKQKTKIVNSEKVVNKINVLRKDFLMGINILEKYKDPNEVLNKKMKSLLLKNLKFNEQFKIIENSKLFVGDSVKKAFLLSKKIRRNEDAVKKLILLKQKNLLNEYFKQEEELTKLNEYLFCLKEQML